MIGHQEELSVIVKAKDLASYITNSSANGDKTENSGSGGCNAGFGLFGLGGVLLGLNKITARKKK